MTTNGTALISVIIPCYNHGHFLSQAIESVLSQSYKNVEVIVIDDGSSDNTRNVAESYPGVKYIYQENQRVSAARNNGIENSTGDYLIFLDADDMLLPEGIAINLKFLDENPDVAFVSGGFKFSNKEMVEGTLRNIDSDHYSHFLRANYIIMQGAIMFRRTVFKELRYDRSLPASEDHDLYLKISRNNKVMHHIQPISIYRIHSTNMSSNHDIMLDSILTVLNRQKEFVRNKHEKNSLMQGIKQFKMLYGLPLYENILSSKLNREEKSRSLRSLWTHNKALYVKYKLMKPLMPIVKFLKDFASTAILRQLHKIGMYTSFVPKSGNVHKGDLNRVTPLSTEFGYDRGGPVDRYYIENFLDKHQSCVTGHVMEIGEDLYTLRYGKSKVTKSDILHINDQNKTATIVGDLSDAPHIPDNSFDCIIMTQTLHLIYDYKAALKTCERILKPGGTLLLTVPGISHIDQGDWKNHWLWSFTQASMSRMFSEVFPRNNTVVEAYGNVLVATAFLYGMGLPELKKEQMDFVDPHYQVIITVKATKP